MDESRSGEADLERALPDAYPSGVEWYRLSAPTRIGELTRRLIIRHPSGKRTVILMHEAPGLSDTTLGIADRLAARDFRVVMPLLLEAPRPKYGRLATAAGLARICMHREFAALSGHTTSPIVDWLLALASIESHATGDRPVGVIGMCFSGGFALATALSPDVAASVVSEPALPFPVWFGRLSDLGLSDGDLTTLREQIGLGACLRGQRYSRDIKSPAARIRALARAFPAAEIAEVPTWNPLRHSVLADALRAPDGTPVSNSLVETLGFLDHRLA
jgi:Dienelactone hydrolase family